jgi:uncharacterized membrane protein
MSFQTISATHSPCWSPGPDNPAEKTCHVLSTLPPDFAALSVGRSVSLTICVRGKIKNSLLVQYSLLVRCLELIVVDPLSRALVRANAPSHLAFVIGSMAAHLAARHHGMKCL